MKKLKKIFCLFLVFFLLTCLTGCESKNVKEAKECIDRIYENTYKKAEAEVEMKLYSNSDAHSDKLAFALAESKKLSYEAVIEANTNSLSRIYQNLSKKEKQVIEDYAKTVFINGLIDIWN